MFGEITVTKFFSFKETTIGDCSVLVAETLAIQEAIRTALRMKMDYIIVKSDFQVTIFSIMDKQ